MTKLTYQEQLQQPEWQEVRKKILQDRNYKCEECGAIDKPLQVHHKKYVKGRLAWQYHHDLLQVLCEDCHKNIHKNDLKYRTDSATFIRTFYKDTTQTLKKYDADEILETDFLRFIYIFGENENKIIQMAINNIKPQQLKTKICKKVYEIYIERYFENKMLDIDNITLNIPDVVENFEIFDFIYSLTEKKISKENSIKIFSEISQRILDRNWMDAREEIKNKIQSGQCSDEEALELVRKFDELRRNPPKVNDDVLYQDDEVKGICEICKGPIYEEKFGEEYICLGCKKGYF
jgi:hypothetical protein